MASLCPSLRTIPAAIVDRLRQEILAGEHAPGSPLRQDMIAATYGVSRIPVREALKQLEAEGLVDIAPHRGAVVTTLSAEEVRDIFELRLLLEPRLLKASIPHLSAQDLVDLDTVQAAFAEAIARRDDGQWGLLNGRLHRIMYGRAPLPRSSAIVAGLLQTSERYTRLQLATRAAWLRAQREHAELINLCRQRAVEAAVALLEIHIKTVHEDLKTLMDASIAQEASTPHIA